MNLSQADSTSVRILNTAESLFAQFGYRAVSLRQITSSAEVNLAAVNYHFHDKHSLYRDVLERRLRQINHARINLLELAESKAGAGLVPLPAIIDALARPLFLPDGENGTQGARLMGRILIERPPFTDELLRAEFHPVMNRFGQAIRRHRPDITPQDFLWRFSFIIGSLHHALATLHDMRNLTQGICTEEDTDAALANFTKFAATSLQ